jgi:carboxyl-terminal processing protease
MQMRCDLLIVNQTCRIIGMSMIGIALSTTVFAQAPPAELPVAERAFVTAAIYAGVQMNFAHWEAVPDIDFDAEFRAYLKTAMTAPTRADFDWATMELMAKLHNSHTMFFDRPVFMEEAQKGSGFELAEYGGAVVITHSDVPGLRPGDAVTRVNDQPIAEYLASKLRFMSASSRAGAVRNLPNVGFLWPGRYTITLADGRQVPIDRSQIARTPQEIEGRLVRPDVAYIRIPSFGDPKYEKRALELIGQYKGTKAIIFDVRGNGGGATPADLTRALMDRPYRWWRESTPELLAVQRFRGEYAANARFSWGPEVKQPAAPLYTGRIILLVDGGCGSSCEDFVMPFKDNGRGTLVGETTAGSTGQPYIREFDNGMILLVGSIRATLPDGMPYEGIGIRPDVEVSPTLEDLQRNRDAALDKALDLASRE